MPIQLPKFLERGERKKERQRRRNFQEVRPRKTRQKTFEACRVVGFEAKKACAGGFCGGGSVVLDFIGPGPGAVWTPGKLWMPGQGIIIMHWE